MRSVAVHSPAMIDLGRQRTHRTQPIKELRVMGNVCRIYRECIVTLLTEPPSRLDEDNLPSRGSEFPSDSGGNAGLIFVYQRGAMTCSDLVPSFTLPNRLEIPVAD